jgi:hypothetical protein
MFVNCDELQRIIRSLAEVTPSIWFNFCPPTFRQEAIKHAERERHKKYKKQEEEREVIRQAMRDKVSCLTSLGAQIFVFLLMTKLFLHTFLVLRMLK